MKIKVNGKEIDVTGQNTLIEELRNIGYDIPSLCYDSGASHQASCMVCMVKNVANGQMIPSCSTFPHEGMSIETDTEEVLSLRRMSLELLLSDHRADCEAPCTVVCSARIDVAQVILHYDRGNKDKAYSLLASATDIDNLPCKDCKAPCEKACRRGTVDKCVSVRDLMMELAEAKGLRVVEANLLPMSQRMCSLQSLADIQMQRKNGSRRSIPSHRDACIVRARVGISVSYASSQQMQELRLLDMVCPHIRLSRNRFM